MGCSGGATHVAPEEIAQARQKAAARVRGRLRHEQQQSELAYVCCQSVVRRMDVLTAAGAVKARKSIRSSATWKKSDSGYLPRPTMSHSINE